MPAYLFDLFSVSSASLVLDQCLQTVRVYPDGVCACVCGGGGGGVCVCVCVCVCVLCNGSKEGQPSIRCD